MMKPTLMARLLSLCLLAFTPGKGFTQETNPEEAVRQVVEGFFDALREKDETGMGNALAEGARLMGIRPGPGEPSFQITEFADFIPRAAAMEAELDERHSEVQVEVRGSLANLWQRYHMYVNGEFSHCGTEVVHLYRFPEGWKILHLSETMTNEGCEVLPREVAQK